MACPFCALGCSEGSPTPAEVHSQCRHLQRFVHPDHPGGNSELSAYTKLAKHLALRIISDTMVTTCPSHMAQPAAVTSSSSTTRFGTPAFQSQPQQQQTQPDHRPPVAASVSKAASVFWLVHSVLSMLPVLLTDEHCRSRWCALCSS